MKQIVLDYETYYDSEYSLRKMTPVEYILDPRFEVIGCAVKEGEGKSFWLTHEELKVYLTRLPERVVIISHNALFDMCILSWVYDYVPTLMIDTLGMARAWLGHKLRSLALTSVATHLELGVKGDTVHKVMGMGLAAIKAAGFYEDYAAYSCNDADLCWGIYRALIGQGFPVTEIAVMDTVLRCAVKPRFVLDATLLAEHLHNTITSKQALLDRTGMTDRDALMSNDRFADALRGLGVEPPTKISLTTGKETYAFAKTDEDFMDLEEHENPLVQILVSARLGIKSTIEETRTQRLIKIANLTWQGNRSGQVGLMPMPLRYSGAHTHRLCLVGETGITVLRDNRVVSIRLDTLGATDLVWDGEAFVQHGGLKYAGIKKVIEYDGIVGTPDHRVWTVEHGYLGLAEAKAGGHHIARGEVPDAARIDKTVYWTDPVQVEDPVCLHSVRARSEVNVEGFTYTELCSVQVMRRQSADGWGDTFEGNAGRSSKSKHHSDESAAGSMACYGDPAGKALFPVSGKDTFAELAGDSLANSYADGDSSAPEVHQSRGIELHVLRRARDRDAVHVNRTDGGVDSDQPRAPSRGSLAGPDRLQRTLRTGEPSLGIEGDAGTQSVFESTWDIVDCGPRNRFAANGRIVHNSGDWKLNMQNLPARGNNKIRASIKAPAGHKVVAVDASQIEARVAGWFCGEFKLTNAFAAKEDVYSSFASTVFGYQVKKSTHKVERFIGKTAVLGLQYGLGWTKFQKTVAMQSKAQVGEEVVLSDEEAAKVINTYRHTYSAIPKMWSKLTGLISRMTGPDFYEQVGPLLFEHERIRLPSGLYLSFHGLENKGGQWWFTYGGKPKYLYGGKMLENITQALARIIVMDAAVRVRQRVRDLGADIWLNLQVHDELVYVVPDELAPTMEQIVFEEMCTRPEWGMDIPLDAEGDTGQSYGDAK